QPQLYQVFPYTTLFRSDPKDVSHLVFNGVPFTSNPTAWTSDGDVLYSGSGNLLDNWAIFEATGGGTLTFDTSYDIEEAWDFGFRSEEHTSELQSRENLV